MNILMFFVGLFIGGSIGYIMAAVFNISSREDDKEDI